MHTVIIRAFNDKYNFVKKFDLEVIPQVGWSLWVLNRRVLLTVKWITQDVDNNSVEVKCEADFEKQWDLYFSNTGWQTNNADAFQNDPVVKKAIEKWQVRMERIKREIAKG